MSNIFFIIALLLSYFTGMFVQWVFQKDELRKQKKAIDKMNNDLKEYFYRNNYKK